jgi:hypothetical protein
MRRAWLLAVAAALTAVWLAAPAQADEAARRQAQLRLLCVQLSGGDFSDPMSMAQFRRCMASHNPLQTARQNAAPPPRRQLNLVNHPVNLAPGSGVALTGAAAGCGTGLVWRGATGADHVCVTRQAHAEILSDNAHAAARAVSPGGTCKQGFVWREATPADHVCVPPATRAEVRSQNRAR